MTATTSCQSRDWPAGTFSLRRQLWGTSTLPLFPPSIQQPTPLSIRWSLSGGPTEEHIHSAQGAA
ncbi:hypothetical protein P170DRAFT_440531 [Aspergillus steynii IBT 23096]|uniref:Uncharacterized protein n=1 Tax=Aspergillus steynii IBT 23096 TaxID=1392250 RepID=A0A2I2FUC5_9EURO|nr:uncharacterized protein P170DRAFT_440531 [Aspergillus steynii IBT 23096]PLB44197.1 hypothetical protein P170DRAFT_440531 [Aspergillus steynii IBT 23096]